MPIPLRWEIAYGILRARDTNDVVRQGFYRTRSMVKALSDSGIVSVLEHPEHEWPIIRADRNHGQMNRYLRDGFLSFAIDELTSSAALTAANMNSARTAGDCAGWVVPVLRRV